MKQMIVKPTYIFLNTLGNPLDGFMYVGRPNLDPTQEANQLTVRDGINGPVLAQPIIIQRGITKNTQGQIVTPVISQQEYSVEFQGSNKIKIPELSKDKVFGDGLSSSGGGAGGNAQTFNNLELAITADLDGVNYIYVIGEQSGWEGENPGVGSYYYYDSTQTGQPETGDKFKFFDANGNCFVLEDELYDNSQSGLSAETKQEAIDELKGLIDDNNGGYGVVDIDNDGSILSQRNTDGFSVDKVGLGQFRINLPSSAIWSIDVTPGNDGDLGSELVATLLNGFLTSASDSAQVAISKVDGSSVTRFDGSFSYQAFKISDI